MSRGFQVIKEFSNSNVNLPKRNTKFSAGYDIEIIENIIIKPNEVILAPTGLKSFMLEDEVLKLYPRSSLAVKKGITLPNNVGIIDSDYYNNEINEGHIKVALINFSNNVVKLNKGERVAQGIFTKYLTITDDLESNVVRKGGFGSTGK